MRQLLRSARQLLRLPTLRSIGPVTGHLELQYDRVMHDPVYRRRGRHGVGEHLLPFTEDQVRSDTQ